MSSASKVSPSVAMMNFSFPLLVAGLDRSSDKAWPTDPGSQTFKWMLLVCRTPPTSDLFVLPVLSRFIVTALFPKAAKKAYGNSSASKGCSANSEIACSISTAFIVRVLHTCLVPISKSNEMLKVGLNCVNHTDCLAKKQ